MIAFWASAITTVSMSLLYASVIIGLGIGISIPASLLVAKKWKPWAGVVCFLVCVTAVFYVLGPAFA